MAICLAIGPSISRLCSHFVAGAFCWGFHNILFYLVLPDGVDQTQSIGQKKNQLGNTRDQRDRRLPIVGGPSNDKNITSGEIADANMTIPTETERTQHTFFDGHTYIRNKIG